MSSQTLTREARVSASTDRRLTTAQALVAFLAAQFSERDGNTARLVPALYGIFGHGNVVGLGQALEEFEGDLRYLQGKNEQAMVHAAIGYAKATHRTATIACAGSIGPGAMNMLTGAGTATANRLPVLLLPADVFMHRRQDPVLQQLEHPISRDLTVNDCFRPVSRFFDRITRPEQLLTSLPEAMRVLVDPADTGAVTISLPQDVQGEAFDFPGSFFEPRVWPIPRREAPESEVVRAAQAISSSARPLVIAGGGVRYSEAQHMLGELSARFGIPVAETFAGKGCGPAGELNVGGIGSTGTLAANRLAKTADCVICIGTRLQDFTTGSQSLFQNPDVRFVSINVSTADAHKLGALPVVGDARVLLDQVTRALRGMDWQTKESYRAEVREQLHIWSQALSEDLAPRHDELISQGQVLKALNEQTGDGDVIVTAAGTPPADVHKMWDASNGTECHIEFGFSCMGHEIPAAIGYRLARGLASRDIFAIIGDGTYLMANTELVTAVQEELKVIVVIFENGGFQAIRSLQVGKTGADFGNEFRKRSEQDGRLSGPMLEIDIAANCRSLGCNAFHAASLVEFEQALEQARRAAGPAVITVTVEPHRLLADTECFWDVGIAQASQRDQMRDIAAAHREGQRTQRFFTPPSS